jgi:hypothetical protein
VNRFIACFLFGVIGILCHAGIILEIDPASQTVPLGAQASFSVDIFGLGNGTNLGTYDINLGFDPALLSFSSIVFGDQVDISGLGDIQIVTPSTGTVEVFELSLDSATDLSGQEAAFTLATLTFNTLASGADSPLTLSINVLGDANGNSLSADGQDGSVTISSLSSVPEPSTIVYTIGGLFLVGVLRSRPGRQYFALRCWRAIHSEL